MVYYYLDIETFGKYERPNPLTDRIICITFCALDPATGKQLQEPIVLTEWSSSEEEIVKKLAERMLSSSVFDFIPVGFGLNFDFEFLNEKFRKYGFKANLFSRPHLDLKQTMVLANKGVFKGVKIGADNNPVQDWYEFEDFDSITRHNLQKLEKFLEEYKKYVIILTST